MRYLNDKTTVSCYSLHTSSWNMSQLSNQRMCATDGSHFMSLYPATPKSLATLSFKAPPFRPLANTLLPPTASLSGLCRSRYMSLCRWLGVFTSIKNSYIFGSKIIAIFVILAKDGNILRWERCVVFVYINIYIYIYTNNHLWLIIICHIQLRYIFTNNQSLLHQTITTITSTALPSQS